MASIICSVIVLMSTFFFLPMLYHLPKAVLSAMLVESFLRCGDDVNIRNRTVYASSSGAYLLKRLVMSCFIYGLLIYTAIQQITNVECTFQHGCLDGIVSDGFDDGAHPYLERGGRRIS